MIYTHKHREVRRSLVDGVGFLKVNVFLRFEAQVFTDFVVTLWSTSAFSVQGSKMGSINVPLNGAFFVPF